MKKFYLTFLITSTCFFASSCSTIQPYPGNEKVRLIFFNEINIVANKKHDCNYLGTLISSDGHWYNYLFISNIDLTQGAINDMYNKANKIGANIVYIDDNIDFATSVTLLGQAYTCVMKDDD
jgi:pimeloyl-CoA synthetase